LYEPVLTPRREQIRHDSLIIDDELLDKCERAQSDFIWLDE
jgi:hypothetical protein